MSSQHNYISQRLKGRGKKKNQSICEHTDTDDRIKDNRRGGFLTTNASKRVFFSISNHRCSPIVRTHFTKSPHDQLEDAAQGLEPCDAGTQLPRPGVVVGGVDGVQLVASSLEELWPSPHWPGCLALVKSQSELFPLLGDKLYQCYYFCENNIF